ISISWAKPAPVPRTITLAMASVTFGDLGQLDQDVGRRRRIDEGDAAAPVARARRLVDELHALGAQLCEGALDVLDLQADVVQALAFLGDPLAGLRLRSGGLEELEVGAADRVHGDLRLVIRKLFLV